MPLVRAALLFFFFFCPAGIYMPAQHPADLHGFDARLEQFGAEGQQDSFLYYSDLKARACQSADSLATWGWLHWMAADFLEQANPDDTLARRHLEMVQRTCWREPRNAEEAEPLCYMRSNLGWYFSREGRMLPAVETLEAAARLYEQYRFPDFDAIEYVYKLLGNCYTQLGDNDKAIAVLLKALMVGGENDVMAGLYCNIGIAYWNKNDYDAAEKYHRQGLALPAVSSLKRALLLGALAQTLVDKGQALQAERIARESLRLLPSGAAISPALKYRCYSRRTAGIANLRLGRLAEAGRLLADARADALAAFGPFSRDLGKIDLAAAQIQMEQGNPAAALEAANRALSAVLPGFNPQNPAQNPDRALFYEENTIFEGLTIKARAAQLLFEKDGDTRWLTTALDCHDLAWLSETKLRKTFQYSTSKLDLQTSSRAREESAMQVVRLLYEKTGEPQYLQRAFAIAERSKAALLSEALHDNLVRQRLADNDPRFAALTSLRQNYSLFEKQLLLDPQSPLATQWRREADQLVGQINALETAIHTAYPGLVEQQLATVAEANAGLHDGEALLEYFVGAAAVEVFVFQKNKAPLWHSFAKDTALQTRVRQYLAYFDQQSAILNDPAGYLHTAYTLWQQLLPPAVADATSLTILPDGFINFIPFDALVASPPTPGTSLRQADYLLRRQEVRYAWSLGVLRQQKSLQPRASGYALTLAPGFAGRERGLAPLASPVGERPAGSKTLLNEQADLQHFMAAAGEYRVLHLSTHAFASVQEGQLPRLELYDQSLFLPSIYALPLRADLVTLSACQTGLGHEQSGEGVMSLARAFAQAGAACVVSSLWSVNDQSTSQLLSDFYRNLETGQSIGQALRDAKRAYLDNPDVRSTMQTPYFWAGLTMVGDDRPVESGRGFWAWWMWGVVGALGLGVGVWLWRRIIFV